MSATRNRVLVVIQFPTAVSIMGGLLVATILDRLALPALYVAWFRIQPPESTAS